MSLLPVGVIPSAAVAYNINNSLRFRSSASASLSRTPTINGSQTIFTLSAWIKLGSFVTGNNGFIWASADPSNVSANAPALLWELAGSTFKINISNRNSGDLITTLVLRDPSAWYHIVLAYDTTQATAANRVKLYLNGVQVTAFDSASYPAQNTAMFVNTTAYQARLGCVVVGSPTRFFDGYIAEVNFVDGQQLTPTSFGETDTTTGVWKPKAYTGTYGTNGFYLKFSDIATTSGSNAGLGKDFSGNANYWTTNNISVTAGTTYDAMTDSPTLTSETVGNYCVLNPLDTASTVTNGNLTSSGGAAHQSVRSTIQIPTTGKWYAEAITTSTTNSSLAAGFGLMSSTTSLTAATNILAGAWNIYAVGDRTINRNGSNTTFGTGFTAGDVLQIAVDPTNNRAWFGVNNSWYNSTSGTTGSPTSGTNPTVTSLPTGLFAFVSHYANTMNANFGQRPFAYTPPTGFKALNTFNLPTSTIVKGNSYMDATLWLGNNASPRSFTNAGGFRPDLVWIKNRSTTDWHGLYDASRGVNNVLYSNRTDPVQINEPNGYLSAFNSNGFSVVAGGAGSNNVNASTRNYVGWQWQAGSSAVTNTSGTLSAQVRANTTAGFSIVTYTGVGANRTVGHGLGVAPAMVIVKRTNGTANNWQVCHRSIAAASSIQLNLTNAAATATTVWNSTAPTSTVFSIGTNADVNTNGGNYVAYCWAEIAGFSSFGSYTGNGSTDGLFIYLGFRPKFVMYKRTNSATSANWWMQDASRNTFNPTGFNLQANTGTAETNNSPSLDFLANGYKIRTSLDGTNANGSTYIYMAFAENPFKNSLAR